MRKHTKKTKSKTKLTLKQQLRLVKKTLKDKETSFDYLQCRYNERLKEIQPPFVWRTLNGRELMPKDMDDRHLQNTIHYLCRTMYDAYSKEAWLSRRFAGKVEALHHMLTEAKRRGLEV